MLRSWEELSKVEQLQSIYSDFHKDVHGFRPRFASDEEWVSEVWLQEQIDGLHAYIDSRKATFAGREQLREEGWSVPETEPELIQKARWLQEERDRQHKEEFGDYA